MNDYQRSKLKSYRAVTAVLDRYPDEVASVAAIGRVRTWLAEQLADLEAAVTAQAGYAPQSASKQALREALADAAVPVAQALSAQADEAEDPATADQFDLPRTAFLRGPEQDALDRATHVSDAAQADPAALTEYGIEADDVAALDAARGAFGGVLTDPRNAVVARRAHTAAIERLVPAIEARLKRRLDKLMTRFDGTPFGDEYRAARTVVDE